MTAFDKTYCLMYNGEVGTIRHERVRLLNGDFVGGYATLRKEVVVMKKYIIRIIFFVIIIFITFTVKVK